MAAIRDNLERKLGRHCPALSRTRGGLPYRDQSRRKPQGLHSTPGLVHEIPPILQVESPLDSDPVVVASTKCSFAVNVPVYEVGRTAGRDAA